METRFRIFILAFCALTMASALSSQQTKSFPRTSSFNENWRFLRDSVDGAENPGFRDATWRVIDLPHDWSVEDLPNQDGHSVSGPFSMSSIGKNATGWSVGGTGWYRKTFYTQKSWSGKTVELIFDGVYMNSTVWLNGHLLGNHFYGYTPFHYDLTQYLNPAGKANVVAVKVENIGKNSRWYSGSGIYRDVILTVKNRIHIDTWGVHVNASEATDRQANVKIETTVLNQAYSQKPCTVTTTVIDGSGKAVAKSNANLTIKPNLSATINQTFNISQPTLWSVDQPRMCKAVTEIKVNGSVVDREETPFGIRSIKFSPTDGFSLNGKKMLLKGGCIHHDNGPVGSAAFSRAEARKIALLKKNGFNAIRLSHNPPSEALLNACDRLGMLVIDEAFDMWNYGKNPDDYHLRFKECAAGDIEAMMLRDRNHPSVIIWSIGNEIPERGDSIGYQTANYLAKEIKKYDSSRPVTSAVCHFWESGKNKKTWKDTKPYFDALDIGGYNYLYKQYETDHKDFPERIMIGTESFPLEALENWNQVEKYPFVIGDFVWTAVDYLGEAAIGNTRIFKDNVEMGKGLGWPWVNAWCGDIDLIGNKKPQSLYRDVVWKRSGTQIVVHRPMAEGAVEKVSSWGWPDELNSWTWPGDEGKTMTVRVFSLHPDVQLTLNGKIIGTKTLEKGSITAVFEVPYEPGTLKAVSSLNGTIKSTATLETTGKAAKIALIPEISSVKYDRNELVYIRVKILDENGRTVPTAENAITFTVNGAGELYAVGNANPTDISGFRNERKHAFRGEALVILRPTGKVGKITLTAKADGLKSAEASIPAVK